ncbi:YqgE/AlgH family protein [Caulobacter sp. S45]|uniref:YqgE/AlgH family protein n=1 Tax=Caulobacter sp. S45 TaxID=1641861 RepID=UPI00131C8C2E|nr:YqgE/AlgH family protein [Caulobacter sp. S45]
MTPTDGDGEFLDGRLLIAMPGIGDPRFERAVILMCTHSDESAMGVAVNNPVEGLSLSHLLERLEVKPNTSRLDQLVLAGGPVERERGFVIHTDDFSTADATLPVTDGIALTPTREVLEAIADVDRRPRHSVLALGCAVWGAGQLEQEIRDSVWLSCDADEDLVFDDDYGSKWARALAKIGVTVDHLSTQSGRA